MKYLRVEVFSASALVAYLGVSCDLHEPQIYSRVLSSKGGNKSVI